MRVLKWLVSLFALSSASCAINVGERTREDLREGPPDFVLESGIEVYLYGQESHDFQKPFLDESVALFIEEFSYRYPPLDYTGVKLHFVPYDRWLDEGELVEGLAYRDNLLMVGAGNWRLWRTAFVHEMVHGSDHIYTGESDGTHKSWEGAINDSIRKVEQQIYARTK